MLACSCSVCGSVCGLCAVSSSSASPCLATLRVERTTATPQEKTKVKRDKSTANHNKMSKQQLEHQHENERRSKELKTLNRSEQCEPRAADTSQRWDYVGEYSISSCSSLRFIATL